MEQLNMIRLGLVLHIAGITMMVGILVANFIAYRQIWIFLPQEKEKALVLTKVISKLSRIMGAGGILILFSGVLMLYALHGAVMHQTWFGIKMALLLLVVLNVMVVARSTGIKLRKVLNGHGTNQVKIAAIKKGINLFHLLQLSLFLIIFILSIFKFD